MSEKTPLSFSKIKNPSVVQPNEGESDSNVDDHTSSRKSRKSVCSSHRSSGSLRTRRKLEAELAAAEELSRLEEEEDKEYLELRKRRVERKKDLVKCKLKVKQAIIDEEADNSQELSSEDERLSEGDQTEKPHDEKNIFDAKIDTDDLLRRLDALKTVDRKAVKTVEKEPETSTPVKEDPKKIEVNDLAKVFAEALGNATAAVIQASPSRVKPSEPDKMNQFLARQSFQKELPFYDGNPLEWPNFISQYKQSTSDCKFSNSENMSRLRKCLKGKAREHVQALLAMPDSVKDVIDQLESRFGKSDKIVRALIENAKRVSAPKDGRWDSILDFSSAVQNLAMTVEMLNCKGHLHNPQLLDDLLDKLPNHLKMSWGNYLQENVTGEETLKDFAKWTKKISDAASRLDRTTFESCSKEATKIEKKYEQKKPSRFQKRETAPVFVTNETNDKCLFCQKSGHRIRECDKFKSAAVEDRWNRSKELKLCFSCITPGHRTDDCKRKRECGLGGCKNTHNRLLHKEQAKPESTPPAVLKQEDKPEKPEVKETPVERLTHTYTKANGSSKVLLRIVPVILKGPAGSISSYALFDEAATVTLMDEETAENLGLKGSQEPLCLKWANETVQNHDDSTRVQVEICGIEKHSKVFKIDVRTIKGMSLPKQTVNIEKLAERWKYLDQTSAKSYSDAQPLILIGQNNAKLTIPRKVLEGPKGAPIASNSKLGWAVHGPIVTTKGKIDHEFTFHICHQQEEKDNQLHELVKESFRIESAGIQPKGNQLRSKEDIRAEKILENTTKRIGNEDRWETGLLWKYDEINLPESKSNAFIRLKCMEKKMDKSVKFKEAYCAKIKDYEDKGYIRKLIQEEKEMKSSRLWYLPHFAVENPNKPGKIRLIFDAAAKSHGVSLNDNLIPGPDLLKSLMGILCKFRERKIGFGGDITEMFPQVRIREEDLISQRFLRRGDDRNREPDVYVMKVMIFGAVCSPCSAQYVKNRNALEFEQQHPSAVKAILNRHYMDDYLDSKDTEEEAIEIFNEVKNIHLKGGFSILSGASSSKTVLQNIAEKVKTKNMKNMKFGQDNEVERVLGLWWDPGEDVFTFKLNFHRVPKEIMSGEKVPTKREVLRLVMSAYDPLGFIAHFVIKAKMLLQDIWKAEIQWDEELPDDLNIQWKKWLSELPRIQEIRIPRCYALNIPKAKKIELHLFCDASSQAYSAVAYLRVVSDNKIETTFVAAKSKVAPKKTLTIPKLELQGAVIASRLMQFLMNELEIHITAYYMWTDAKTVLDWLRSTAKKLPTFESHRVAEIQELTTVSQWRWVPTELNPADDATRDSKKCDFSPECRWYTGPEYLRMDESEWPTEPWTKNTDVSSEDEIEETENVTVTVDITKLALPDVERFSSYMRLIRSTAWLLRYVKNLKSKSEKVKDADLNPNEYKAAEKLWWRKVQADGFYTEVNALRNEKLI